MRLFPGLVVHRWCPLPDAKQMTQIGKSRDHQLTHLARPETVRAFREMNAAAHDDKVKLHVIWAFRDPKLQAEQFEDAKKKHGPRNGIKWLAPPGFSEHQTGWVLDLGDLDDEKADDNPLFERTAAFKWLKKNAHKYGFELSFPPGNWQGVSYEPWHWRWTGSKDAQRTFHPRGLRAVMVWGKSWCEALRWWLRPA